MEAIKGNGEYFSVGQQGRGRRNLRESSHKHRTWDGDFVEAPEVSEKMV
jgi:hypothetical protein